MIIIFEDIYGGKRIKRIIFLLQKYSIKNEKKNGNITTHSPDRDVRDNIPDIVIQN